MYGTVTYFTDHLINNTMNRLVDETVFSSKETYLQLKEDIHHSEDSNDMKTFYLKNLDIAYTHVREQLLGMGKMKNE